MQLRSTYYYRIPLCDIGYVNTPIKLRVYTIRYRIQACDKITSYFKKSVEIRSQIGSSCVEKQIAHNTANTSAL